MLNHIPVWAAIVGVLLLVVGVFRAAVGRAALWFFFWAGVVAIPVFLSGNKAEHALERIPEAREELVEAHEDFALYGFVSALALGLLAAVGLSRHGSRRFVRVGIWILAIATAGMLAWTAALGGRINHPEVREAIGAAVFEDR